MNRFSAVAAVARNSGTCIDLSSTSFADCGWPRPRAALQRGFAHYLDSAGYSPDPAGALAAREAIAGYYQTRGMSLDPQRLVLTAGTSEAFALTILAVTEPGDGVLVPLPGYPLFEEILRLHGREPRFYPLRASEQGWYLDPGDISRQITPNTRHLLVISPNNPTGWIASPAESRAIERICREHSLGLIWDEVFAEYVHRNRAVAAGAPADSEVPLYILGGVSKPFLAPGLKCGWVAAPLSAVGRMLIINDLFLNVSAAAQHCIPELFRLSPLPAAAAAAHAAQAARELPRWLPPGWRCIPGSGGIHRVITRPSEAGFPIDDEEFSVRAAQQQHTCIQPGYLYGFDEHPGGCDPHWVVSLILPHAQQQEGWRRLGLVKTEAED